VKPRGRVVVKIGGGTLGVTGTAAADIAELTAAGWEFVIVHGGGQRISEQLDRAGIETTFVDGLRATSAEAIPVVASALDSVNNEVAGELETLGLSLARFDSSRPALVADPIPALGRVGEVGTVRVDLIRSEMSAGRVPLIACLASDNEGLLNINGDTAAGEIAVALGASQLLFLTDVPGVRSQDGKLLPVLHIDDAALLVADGTASGGMAPKLRACMRAAARGVATAILDGRVDHAIPGFLAGKPGGTRVGVAGALRS
jgi:acetylglutamate kinase